MKLKKQILLILIIVFYSGCIGNQLAGRHYIRHPETDKKLWAPYYITAKNWDSDDKVWRSSDGAIVEDYYLYPEKQEKDVE